MHLQRARISTCNSPFLIPNGKKFTSTETFERCRGAKASENREIAAETSRHRRFTISSQAISQSKRQQSDDRSPPREFKEIVKARHQLRNEFRESSADRSDILQLRSIDRAGRWPRGIRLENRVAPATGPRKRADPSDFCFSLAPTESRAIPRRDRTNDGTSADRSLQFSYGMSRVASRSSRVSVSRDVRVSE